MTQIMSLLIVSDFAPNHKTLTDENEQKNALKWSGSYQVFLSTITDQRLEDTL